jgi:hypothetical protein
MPAIIAAAMMARKIARPIPSVPISAGDRKIAHLVAEMALYPDNVNLYR